MKRYFTPLLILAVFGFLTGFYTPVHAAGVTFVTGLINQGNNPSVAAGTAAGTVLIAYVANGAGGDICTTATYNGQTISATDKAAYGPASVGEAYVYYFTGVSGTNTLTINGTCTAFNLQYYVYSGVGDSGGVPDSHHIATGAGTSATGNTTTVKANAVVWAGVNWAASGTGTGAAYSTNFTNNLKPTLCSTAQGGGTAANCNGDSGAIASPGVTTSAATVESTISGNWNMFQVSMAPISATTPINFLQEI